VTGRIHAGYAVIAGAANSGKSSLINAMTGFALSPVTEHPGTTRVPVTAVLSRPDVQICLIDTPPMEFAATLDLMSWMDALCLVVDCRSIETGLASRDVDRLMEEFSERPVVLALTHSDHFPGALHRALAVRAGYLREFAAVCPVCPLLGSGVDDLRKAISAQLPVRRRLFPEDCRTLHSDRFLVSEMIRTRLYEVLPAEIASGTAVQIEEYSLRDAKTYVRANLLVARHSSKGMVIGRKGQTLQRIVETTVRSALDLLGRQISLDLWVKVRESWPDNPHDLLEFGYVR
jgi:GTPase